MSETPPPSPQDISAFVHALHADLGLVLADFGLKIAVVHSPALIPLSPGEAKRARNAARQRMREATANETPNEAQIAALRTLLGANDGKYTVLRQVTQTWLTKQSEPIPSDEPPPSPPSTPDAT